MSKVDQEFVDRAVTNIREMRKEAAVLSVLGAIVEMGDEARLHETRAAWDDLRATIVALMERLK